MSFSLAVSQLVNSQLVIQSGQPDRRLNRSTYTHSISKTVNDSAIGPISLSVDLIGDPDFPSFHVNWNTLLKSPMNDYNFHKSFIEGASKKGKAA